MIVPVPTFPIFTQLASVQDVDLKTPEYTDDFKYPMEKVKALVSDRTKLIVICTPNNPTGTLVEPSEIIDLAKSFPNTQSSSMSVTLNIQKAL